MASGFRTGGRGLYDAPPVLSVLGARAVPYTMKGWPPGSHRGLPDGRLVLLVSTTEPVSVEGPQHGPMRMGVSLAGIHDGAVAIRHHGREEGVQVDLTPRLVRALFGISPGTLVNRIVPVSDLDSTLEDQLVEAARRTSPPLQRAAAIENILAARLGGVPAPRLVDHAWGLLESSGGSLRIAVLARDLGVSRRYLDRLFLDEAGLPPKSVARMFRVMRSRRYLAAAARPSLVEAALAAGFFDQSHMIGDWKQIAGMTPGEWLREELPYFQHGVVAAER
jgi:AraC-like DNA-binding protein